MALRTSLLALPLLLIGSALAGQDTATDQAVPDSAEAAPVPAACRRADFCPDPMTLDTAGAPFARDVPVPGQRPVMAIPKPPKRYRVHYVPVLFKDGKIFQIKKYQRKQVRAGGHVYRAGTGMAPWMAQIQRPVFVRAATSRALNWQDRQLCGGAYIAPGWIVTAAHCLKDYGMDIKSAGYRIRLGVTDIRSPSQGASYRIVRILEHPNYGKPSAYYNDIALIQFAADAETARGQPAPVRLIAVDRSPPGQQSLGGKEAWFFGWGVTDNQVPAPELMYGKIKLQPDSGCANFLIALCGRGDGARGSTQCHGDSGGPLILKDGGLDVLVGLVSHNQGMQRCGVNMRQGVYTRIAAQRGWIEGYTGPLQRPMARRRS